ncbi:hypothetical protein WICPIJ_006174 [Wickerhamomyces pijperi]|uniref:Uncharacterized protein n=1 Tax=Wickerhamomyces pijperi TaxID=599730 RepID=A0A9P8TL89_WICPI|nr:hypothetical protein WICPIJ_006174 [Wickerhamomyces pijperi]
MTSLKEDCNGLTIPMAVPEPPGVEELDSGEVEDNLWSALIVIGEGSNGIVLMIFLAACSALWLLDRDLGLLLMLADCVEFSELLVPGSFADPPASSSKASSESLLWS